MAVHWIYGLWGQRTPSSLLRTKPQYLPKVWFLQLLCPHKRHNSSSEGGRQMLSDTWKTNYLKEQHIKNIWRAACHAALYRWSTTVTVNPFSPLTTISMSFPWWLQKHAGMSLLPSNTVSMAQVSYAAPVWSSLHRSCFLQHFPPMFRGKEVQLHAATFILHGITKHTHIQKKKKRRYKSERTWHSRKAKNFTKCSLIYVQFKLPS